MAKQPWRKTSDTVRSRALQDLPRGKNRRKSVGAGKRQPPDYHDRLFCECLRPRNPSLLSRLPRKRHNRFHPRRSCARRSLKIESHFNVVNQPRLAEPGCRQQTQGFVAVGLRHGEGFGVPGGDVVDFEAQRGERARGGAHGFLRVGTVTDFFGGLRQGLVDGGGLAALGFGEVLVARGQR